MKRSLLPVKILYLRYIFNKLKTKVLPQSLTGCIDYEFFLQNKKLDYADSEMEAKLNSNTHLKKG
jgi:hypothetical protein